MRRWKAGIGPASPLIEISRHMDSDSWRTPFAAGQLRIPYYLGLVANPFFLVSDVLFYRDQITPLVARRATLEGSRVAHIGHLIARCSGRAGFPLSCVASQAGRSA
jgi:hypothetical protein